MTDFITFNKDLKTIKTSRVIELLQAITIKPVATCLFVYFKPQVLVLASGSESWTTTDY